MTFCAEPFSSRGCYITYTPSRSRKTISTGQEACGCNSEMKMWSGRVGNAFLVRNFNKYLHVVLHMNLYIHITSTLYASHYFCWPTLFVTSCLFLTNYHLSLPTIIPTCMWVSSWVVTHKPNVVCLTFRHCASCILGQAFHFSPENAFYIFNQQIYFIIWYLLDRASLI